MRTNKRTKGLNAEDLFIKAYELEEQEDFKGAFDCLLVAAQLGHVSSQINLGNFYSWGSGTRKSAEDAAYWYKRAYRNGNGTGAFNIGIDKRNSGNLRSAAIWFRKASEMNYGEANVELARIVILRRGGKKKACDLLRQTQSMKIDVISDDAKKEAAMLLAQLGC